MEGEGGGSNHETWALENVATMTGQWFGMNVLLTDGTRGVVTDYNCTHGEHSRELPRRREGTHVHGVTCGVELNGICLINRT